MAAILLNISFLIFCWSHVLIFRFENASRGGWRVIFKLELAAACLFNRGLLFSVKFIYSYFI